LSTDPGGRRTPVNGPAVTALETVAYVIPTDALAGVAALRDPTRTVRATA